MINKQLHALHSLIFYLISIRPVIQHNHSAVVVPNVKHIVLKIKFIPVL